MKKQESILRLPDPGAAALDPAYFGLNTDDRISVRWPEICPATGEKADTSLNIQAGKKHLRQTFSVPVSRAVAEAAGRGYSWVTTAGIWICNVGVISLFITLYFMYSFSTGGGDGSKLFLPAFLSILLIIAGFAFMRIMNLVIPSARGWSAIAGVKIKLVRANPHFNDFRFRFRRGDYAEEFARLNRKLERTRVEAAVNRQLEQARRSTVESGDAQSLFGLGLALERSGALDDANDAFRKALEKDPGQTAAWKHIAINQFWFRRLSLADEALANYLKEEPEDSGALVLMGLLKENRKNGGEAERYYKEALAVEEGVDVRELLGDLYFKWGRLQQALEQYQAGVNLSGDSGELGAKRDLVKEKLFNQEGHEH